jgi:hypothetical protein
MIATIEIWIRRFIRSPAALCKFYCLDFALGSQGCYAEPVPLRNDREAPSNPRR